MKITKIFNVRGIKETNDDFQLDLFENNLIYATNGTGKTTITGIIEDIFINRDSSNLLDKKTGDRGFIEVIDEDNEIMKIECGEDIPGKLGNINVAKIDLNESLNLMKELEINNNDPIPKKSFVKNINDLSEYQKSINRIKNINSLAEILGIDNFDKLKTIFDFCINSLEENAEDVFKKGKQNIGKILNDNITIAEPIEVLKSKARIEEQFKLFENNDDFNIFKKYNISLFSSVKNFKDLKENLLEESRNYIFNENVKSLITLEHNQTKYEIEEFIEKIDAFVKNGNVFSSFEEFYNECKKFKTISNLNKSGNLEDLTDDMIKAFSKITKKLKKLINSGDESMIEEFVSELTQYFTCGENYRQLIVNDLNGKWDRVQMDNDFIASVKNIEDKLEHIEVRNTEREIRLINDMVLKVSYDDMIIEGTENGFTVDDMSLGEQHLLIDAFISKSIVKGERNILLIDDIGDPFDYAFKHHFINCVKNLNREGNSIIFFMHNFDFLSSLSSALGKKNAKVNRMLKEEGKLFFQLVDSKLLKDFLVFKEFSISALPILRSFMIMFNREKLIASGGKEIEYHCLLHYQKELEDEKARDILEIINNEIFQTNFIIPEDIKYYDFLDEVLEKELENSGNSFEDEIKAKISMAIMIRLKVEKILMEKEPNFKQDYKFGKIIYFCNKYLFNKGNEEYAKLGTSIKSIVPDYAHLDPRIYSSLIDTDYKVIKEVYLKLIKILEEIRDSEGGK